MAPFTCACGKYNKEVVLRYRLEVMINHGDESTKFLLWDRECSELIGQSADAVNKLKIEDGDIDLNASPEALDKLLGYVLAGKCSTDSSLINVVMDMLADAETSSKINIPAFDSNHSTQHEFVTNILDSSEDESSESTQGSDSVSSPENQNCMSSTNEPAINRERYSDLGDQLMQCSHSNANMWYDERISKRARTTNPRFSLCCGGGKVELPLLHNPPKYLYQHLYDHDTSDSKNYQQNIRTYNMMFSFTSAGIKFNKSINHSRGPPTIRIQGLQRIMLRDLSDVDKIRRPIYIAGVMCNGKRSHAKMSQYDEILDQFVFMHPLGYREILSHSVNSVSHAGLPLCLVVPRLSLCPKLCRAVNFGVFEALSCSKVLDMQTYETWQREYALKGHRHFYFMTLNASEV
ncbi:hypothetical protein JHK82_052937 [Glycine max]|nr:hypothetical protein JHK85_053640 [Glycine max]KAG5085540.1 hypothetical protein JHK82_052937 [Glycine max]